MGSGPSSASISEWLFLCARALVHEGGRATSSLRAVRLFNVLLTIPNLEVFVAAAIVFVLMGLTAFPLGTCCDNSFVPMTNLRVELTTEPLRVEVDVRARGLRVVCGCAWRSAARRRPSQRTCTAWTGPRCPSSWRVAVFRLLAATLGVQGDDPSNFDHRGADVAGATTVQAGVGASER